MIIFGLTLAGVLRPVIQGITGRDQKDKNLRRRFSKPRLSPTALFSIFMIAVFASFFYQAGEFEFGAQLVPRLVTGFGILFISAQLFSDVFFVTETLDGTQAKKPQIFDITHSFDDLSSGEMLRRAVVFAAWALSVVGMGYLIGLLPAVLVFLLGYMRFHGKESWGMVLAVGLTVWLFYIVLFQLVLDVHWPHSWIGAQFPLLRSKFEIF
jgi:hypothetical protein